MIESISDKGLFGKLCENFSEKSKLLDRIHYNFPTLDFQNRVERINSFYTKVKELEILDELDLTLSVPDKWRLWADEITVNYDFVREVENDDKDEK